MKKFKNVFLLAAMAVSAVFVACDKEDDGFALKDTTLKLTANNGSGTTTITFISATEFRAETTPELRAGGDGIKTGTYTFDGQTLTLTFSDGTPSITLTKAGDTFTSADYTVTTSDDPDDGGNTAAFDGKIQAEVSVPDGIAIAEVTVKGGEEEWNLAKSAKYENGTLTIELLNPVPSELLQLKDGVKLASPRNGGLEAYDAGGNRLGSFRYQNANGGVVKFVYVESDVTIYDCSLKKGWNKLFTYEDNQGVSTTIPSDVKWIFKQ
ncbi:hypothetical protein AGMMS4957_12520 [Bacteroidia bacterium]|nr:hypothetical protein AGMMS4957_12520 [Bacteroidia bacterium]